LTKQGEGQKGEDESPHHHRVSHRRGPDGGVGCAKARLGVSGAFGVQ
jgi:hypothetical protein